MVTTTLDLAGLKCPLPALKTRKALALLRPGDRLEVICTDPLAMIDIPALVQQSGDRLQYSEQKAGAFVFVIEKQNAAIAKED